MTDVTDLGYIKTSDSAAANAPVLTGAGIQALIDALPSTGGTVQLVAGVYPVSVPITINKPNVAIKGVDEKATSIVFTQNGICFDFQSQATTCEMSDLTITGPAHTAATSSKAINIQLGASLHATDLTIYGCKIAINNFGASEDTLIDYVTYKQSGSITCGAFLVSDRKDGATTVCGIHLSHCNISDCNDNAMTIVQSSRTHIESCVVQNQAAATNCILFGSSAGFLTGLEIEGCEFSATAAVTNAIRAVVSGTQNPDDIMISACVFNVPAAVANSISIDLGSKASKLTIRGCTFDGTPARSILLTGVLFGIVSGCSNRGLLSGNGLIDLTTCVDCMVTGCYAQNNGFSCIALTNSNGIQIVGCSLTRGSGSPGGCILVAGTSTNCTISGCYIQCLGTSSAGVELFGTGHVVTGNRITANTGNCVGFQANADFCSVVGNMCTNTGGGTAILLNNDDFCTVSGNVVNNTAGGLCINITVTSVNAAVTGNVFNTTAANAANIDATSSATSFSNCIKGVWTGTPANLKGGPNGADIAATGADKIF